MTYDEIYDEIWYHKHIGLKQQQFMDFFET